MGFYKRTYFGIKTWKNHAIDTQSHGNHGIFTLTSSQ